MVKIQSKDKIMLHVVKEEEGLLQEAGLVLGEEDLVAAVQMAPEGVLGAEGAVNIPEGSLQSPNKLPKDHLSRSKNIKREKLLLLQMLLKLPR